jgi:uncharacterized membrane protein YfcA
MVTHGTIYAIAGAFAGLVSGLFGIGGGVVVVPALAYIFSHHDFVPAGMAMHMAAATSLAIMIFTSQSTVRAYTRQEQVLWPRFNSMILGIVIGTVLGVTFASYVPTDVLRIILGLFLLVVAFEMAINFKVKRSRKRPSWWFNSSVSSLIGFKSGLLGVGGGVVVIPYLNWCGVNARKIAAISALCTMTVSIVGASAFIVTSYHLPDLPSYATGYVYWPAVLLVAFPSMYFAPIGAKISYNLPMHKLKVAFTLILILTAIDLIID